VTDRPDDRLIDRRLEFFVDRTAATEQILHLLSSTHEPTVIEVQGIRGSGKSLLLQHLRSLVEDLPRQDRAVRTVLTSLRAYALPRSDGQDGEAVAAESDEQYRRLLTALAARLAPGDDTAFAGFADAALPTVVDIDARGAQVRGGDIVIGDDARVDVGGSLGSAHLEVSVALTDAEARRRGRGRMTRAFRAACAALARGHRLVLLLDDGDDVLRQPAGQWLLDDVVLPGPDLFVVVVRGESEHHLTQAALSIHLTNLGREHVAAYLARRLPATAPLEDFTDAIYRFSAGHPDAVSTAVDLVEQRGPAGHEALIQLFADLPTGRGEHLSRLVDAIIDGMDDPRLREAFEVAWIVRSFDAPLLAALLTGPGEVARPVSDYVRVVEALSEYSFTEPCAAPASPGGTGWRFHDFIRRERDRRFARRDPATYVELHRRASDYFGARLAEEEGRPDETSYARALRQDGPVWQSLQRQWLYHLEQMSDRRAAGTRFAVAYLRTFYWYGWYEEHSLCPDLLQDWQLTQHTDEDAQWLALLQDFSAAYPTVWRHQDPDWDTVEEVMWQLLALGGAAGDLAGLSTDQNRLRAVCSMFIAQSRLRRVPPDVSGQQFYEDARRLLRDLRQEQWLGPWAGYWLGQTALELGELERASRECETALALAGEQGDEELRACAWQFRGDLRYRRGDAARAVRAHLLGLCAAFRFLGLPAVSDAYTRSFYDEVASGLAARILTMHQDGAPGPARAGCATVRAALAPVWTALGVCPLPPDNSAQALQRADVGALRSALLLDHPPREALRERIVVRRACGLLRRTAESLERDDRADPGPADPGPGSPEGGVLSRLRYDLRQGDQPALPPAS